MRLPLLPRSILLGLVYLALHLACTVYVHEGIGTTGPGPWISAGIGLGFLIIGGAPMIPFILLGNFVGGYVVLPTGSGVLRVAWPIVLTTCWTLAAWEVRRVSGQFKPWTSRGTSHFALCALFAAVVSSALGAALLKSGDNGSVVPLPALALGILEPQLLGLLFVTPVLLHVAGHLRPQGSPRVFLKPAPRSELGLQLLGVLLGLWLFAHADAVCWALPLIFLVWIAVRQGLAGGACVGAAYCLAASFNRELTVPDVEGLRPIIVFEISIAVVALGLGAWADENRAKRRRLQESCDRMDMLLEHGGAGIWDWNVGSPILCEGAWHNLCSLPPGTSQISEETWLALLHPDDMGRVRAAREVHLRGESPRYEVEYRIRSSSGFYRWVFDRGVVMRRDTNGRGVRMVGLCMDLSSRKHAENSQLRFMDLLDASADPVSATDLHGNVFYANRSLLSLHGDGPASSAQPRHISDYFSEASAKTLLRDVLPQVLKAGAWWGVSELIDAGGHGVPVSVGISLQRDPAGHPRSFGFLMRRMDLIHSERPKVDFAEINSRSQAERQESLRLLAGGAVHGFNNVLMAIMGNAFLARKDLPPDAPARHFFQQIDQATQRGSQLCHTLQLFSGKVAPGSAKLDVNAHLKAALADIGRELKRPDLVIFVPGADLPSPSADAGQITKALRHLLLNAFEAYGDSPGPVRVRTTLVEVDPATFSSPAPGTPLQKGPHVLIEVSDDGPGLETALHSRIFDPFFTTKAGHKGIGLAEVAGVVRGHGGGLTLISQPGTGFTLRMHFPLVQLRPGTSPTRSPLPVATSKWKGSGQVLVIDDEETVREVTASMLESLGFAPLVARDGVEGLRVVRQHADTLKLVLLDYTMPIMDGESTLAELAKLKPDLPVLFMTGHEARDLKSRVDGGQLAGVLGKPFPVEVLQQQLRKALGVD